MERKKYRWCSVPQCKNTSVTASDKIFIGVPRKQDIRKKWFDLAKLELKGRSVKSPIYFCEDHFDLPNIMENYMQFHIMGSVNKIILKPGTLPSKFHCQHDRKRCLPSTSKTYPGAIKRQRSAVIQEALEESNLKSNMEKETTTVVDLKAEVETVQQPKRQEKGQVLGQVLVKYKPILQFLKRLLIVNNSSQNTVLTNAQIEDILSQEFELKNLHELEMEIYVTILKKYLKDWPKWDEFDQVIKVILVKNDKDTLENELQTRYKDLKKFLKTKLDTAKTLSVEMVTKAKNLMNESTKMRDKGTSDSKSIVLEVNATREQLNTLIYRYPNPLYNYTIFNSKNIAPSQIRLNTLSLEAILNWWSIRIVLSLQWVKNMSCVFLKRETAHESNFLLMNKTIQKEYQPLVRLNNEIQIKDTKKASRVPTNQILGSLEVLSHVKPEFAVEGLETILEVLKKDIARMEFCAAPAEYRRYLSKYPYVRYLYTDVENAKLVDKAKYDIQLQETLRPMHRFSIGRITDGKLEKNLPSHWLKVECVTCSVKFDSLTLASELIQHFNEYHQSEPDWQCMCCQKTFTMSYLAEKWWVHDCDSDT